MILILYIIVILFATTIGALAGLGGGVIIKPILDLLHYHDIATISFISTSAVFSMSLYSVAKQIKNGIKIDWFLILVISFSAAVGGNIGNVLFNEALKVFSSDLIRIIQATSLIMLLLLAMACMRAKHTLKLNSVFLYILVGVFLGITSSFLGIGGGPINVAVFVYLFSIGLKEATIYSLASILFSQGSKLISIAFTTGFKVYDTSLLIYIIPAAILGGIIGSYLNKRLTEEKIKIVFNISIITIIIINLFILIKTIY